MRKYSGIAINVRSFASDMLLNRRITCIVTGEWADGSKVFTECDPSGAPIDLDTQYQMIRFEGETYFLR